MSFTCFIVSRSCLSQIKAGQRCTPRYLYVSVGGRYGMGWLLILRAAVCPSFLFSLSGSVADPFSWCAVPCKIAVTEHFELLMGVPAQQLVHLTKSLPFAQDGDS